MNHTHVDFSDNVGSHLVGQNWTAFFILLKKVIKMRSYGPRVCTAKKTVLGGC